MATAETDMADEVKAEAVPKDTAAELERVKAFLGAQFGFDMRSPGQVKQAELDAADAQKELEVEQEAEAAKAEAEAAAAAAEAEATTTTTSGSSKSK